MTIPNNNLHKTSRGFSAIAELLVVTKITSQKLNGTKQMYRPLKRYVLVVMQ